MPCCVGSVRLQGAAAELEEQYLWFHAHVAMDDSCGAYGTIAAAMGGVRGICAASGLHIWHTYAALLPICCPRAAGVLKRHKDVLCSTHRRARTRVHFWGRTLCAQWCAGCRPACRDGCLPSSLQPREGRHPRVGGVDLGAWRGGRVLRAGGHMRHADRSHPPCQAVLQFDDCGIGICCCPAGASRLMCMAVSVLCIRPMDAEE